MLRLGAPCSSSHFVALPVIRVPYSCVWGGLRSPTSSRTSTKTSCCSPVPPFTTTELDKAMSQLEQGNHPDGRGISSKMMRELLWISLQTSYTNTTPPYVPRRTPQIMEKYHHHGHLQKGDFTQPANYCPIRTIPTLHAQQTSDQVSFKPGHSTTDHLTRSSNIASGLTNGSAACGVPQLTSRKPSTQWNPTASGRSYLHRTSNCVTSPSISNSTTTRRTQCTRK